MLNVLDRILRKADVFNNYILSVVQFLSIIFLCTPYLDTFHAMILLKVLMICMA